jgi:phospholipid transport system substrate-binding protein
MAKPAALFLALLLGAGISGPPAAAGGPDGTAADFIAGLGHEVVQVMSEHEEDRASRHDRLRVLIEEAFSIESMAEATVGPYWVRAAPEQKTRFVEVLRLYLLNYCVGFLDGRAPDSLAVVSAEPIDSPDTWVTTRAKSGNRTLADIDWMVRVVNGAFRIVDVGMNGVSLVTTYKSEFRSVISQRGMNGLILALASKAPNLSAEAAAPSEPAQHIGRTSSP